jgi:hypothetical protein
MWMVDPAIMCRQHLLGEHRELHALRGLLLTGRSMTGYRELVQLPDLWTRHAALVAEMERRGYRHHSPLEPLPGARLTGAVDAAESRRELLRRCAECQARAIEEGIA